MQTFFEKASLPDAHILMPAYNAAPFITHALESVFKQNYANIRLMIINDGSTDQTSSVIENYLSKNPSVRGKIYIENISKNSGIAFTRQSLLRNSKNLNPHAYIFWLDADDSYSDANVVRSVIEQMRKTTADICVFNFSIKYEDPSQIANAEGLIRDREDSQKILEQIYKSPKGAVSPLEVNIMLLTSLGWTKCYAPSAKLPESENYPFEDFVSMAALICANVITVINPEILPIQYLRRSTSICGQRTPENFTLHIPMQMKRFFEAVLESTLEDDHQMDKLQMAVQFIDHKFDQYTETLQRIVDSHRHADIQEPVLVAYKKAAECVRQFITKSITQANQSSLTPLIPHIQP